MLKIPKIYVYNLNETSILEINKLIYDFNHSTADPKHLNPWKDYEKLAENAKEKLVIQFSSSFSIKVIKFIT